MVCLCAGSRSAPVRPHSSMYTLRLVQELLRKDYAVGYLMFGWLLRCTWAVAPAVAAILNLPVPDMRSKVHLPVMIAWLLQQNGDSQAKAEAMAWLLGPEEMARIQDVLAGPTAAVASYAAFVRAQQTLSGAPMTVEQVVTVQHP